MPTQETSQIEILYTETVVNSVGLVGLPDSPDLLATVFPLPAPEAEVYGDLLAFIRPIMPGQTNTSTAIYVDIIEGGIGLEGLYQFPDLFAIYRTAPKISSGTLDLSAIIYAIQQGDKDLYGYIKSAASGSLDLDAQISGFYKDDLYGYIRPSISGDVDLPCEIEPIPGVDLSGDLNGILSDELPSTIESIDPVDLPAEVTGIPALDLFAEWIGFLNQDIQAEISGYYINDLVSIISGYASETTDLISTIRGMLAIDEQIGLSGYIIPTISNMDSLNSDWVGISIKDLEANYLGSPSGINFAATISGDWPDHVLLGEITPTGGINSLSAYYSSKESNVIDIMALISGHQQEDLIANINTDPGDWLIGNIIGGDRPDNELISHILPTEVVELSGSYSTLAGNLLNATVDPIPGSDLYAVITPKVFYIDSSILINTVPVSSLKAIINSEECGLIGDFSDLQVFISGTSSKDLSASIISLSGQYAYTTDSIQLLPRGKVVSTDWIFLIAEQPVIYQEKLPIIITTHPFADLTASIEGIPESSDLSASITSVYMPSARRDGTPLGEWVNTRTGERKLLKLFFRGNAENFYYSSSANKVFAENPQDYLEIVVESYQRIETENTDSESLLLLKSNIKQCNIGRLSDFPSIDEAVKFAIICANSEIAGDLQAIITPVGQVEEITSNIEPIDSLFLRDLYFKINPVANMPDLLASVSGAGDVDPMFAQIFPQFAGVTATPFYDIEGNRYLPTLKILPDGDYTVVLVPISPFETIDVLTPDLYTSISGQDIGDLPATISG